MTFQTFFLRVEVIVNGHVITQFYAHSTQRNAYCNIICNILISCFSGS